MKGLNLKPNFREEWIWTWNEKLPLTTAKRIFLTTVGCFGMACLITNNKERVLPYKRSRKLWKETKRLKANSGLLPYLFFCT